MKPTTALLKTVTLLKREGHARRFVACDDDTGQVVRALVLSDEDFRDLGEPDRLTVTVEPGDKLNPDLRTTTEAEADLQARADLR